MLTRTSALGFIYFTTKLLEDNFRNNLLFTAVAGTAGAISTASALLGGAPPRWATYTFFTAFFSTDNIRGGKGYYNRQNQNNYEIIHKIFPHLDFNGYSTLHFYWLLK